MVLKWPGTAYDTLNFTSHIEFYMTHVKIAFVYLELGRHPMQEGLLKSIMSIIAHNLY